MQRTFARMTTLVLGALPLVLAAGIASGQEPAARDLEAELATAREQATQYSDPQSLEQERWQSAFDARIRVLQDLIRLRADAAGLPDLETIPARKQVADARLDSLRALDGPAAVQLDDPDELADFERALTDREAARDATASAASDLQARIERERDERTALQTRSTEVQGRMSALEGDAPVDAHRRATWQMELEFIAERLSYLSEAAPVWEALTPVLQTERSAAALMYEHARTRATEAREQAAGLREQDVQEQLREAESRAQEADATEDPLESLRLNLESEAVSATARTGLTRSQATRIADQLTTEKDLLAGQQAMRDRLEERVKLGAGGSEGSLRKVVRRIRESRARVQDVARPLVEERLELNQTELATVLDRIWVLQIPESGNETLAALEAAAGAGQEGEAQRIFEELTRSEDGLLPALRGLQDALGDAIRMDSEILRVLDQQLELLGSMESSVRQALLWSRSLPPFSMDAISVAAREIGSLSGFRTAIDVPQSMRDRAQFTFITIATMLIGVAISIWGRRWKIPLPEGDDTWVPRYDMAFVQRLTRGLAWAGGLTVASWMCAYWVDTGVNEGEQAPLSLLFWGVGWFLLVERSVALALDPGGFLSHQLKSSRAAARKTLRGVQLLTSSGIVLLAPAMVTVEPPYSWERVPQLLMIGWMATYALIVARVLSTTSPVVTEWTQPHTPSRRLLTAMGLLVPAICVPMIIFDLLGYRAGSEALFGNLFRLVTALVILLLLYRIIEGTSARISRAVSRRIIRERGWKEAAKAESKIETFLRRTAATVVIVLAALILREAWGIGDTAAELLAGVQLFDAGEGDWVTMMNVVDAIIMLVLGVVLSQALTKTWELVIAPLRGNEVAGSEYATLTMLRYAVLALAVAAALVTMKFSLARLGWLLTALSVGLGFGLQEIVANFVSGLILMIERPVRVGDVVTVGTTAGVVDKISIRATMVTNWDRQTIVVPNRNFITQEVTNWTRQDRIVRRTLKVGVAYGTDVERVLKILDELVAAHPKVLRSPPHRIWFQGFGDSSLNFEMWFYASFDDGLTARSELYAQTYARLNEEGIQIPFPQRDVWLRTEAEKPAGEMPDVPDPEDPAD